MLRIILASSLLCLVSRAEGNERTLPESVADDHCNYNLEKDHDADDLLRCISVLIGDAIADESRALSKNEGLFPNTIFGANPLLSSLNGAVSSLLQPNQSPPVTVPAYQSSYPGTFDLSPGLGINLHGALASISRHDDYKCVPRILCEVASGKFPGRSFGKQRRGFLGRNAFLEWLTAVDLGQSSPLLNFARAMLLGYSQKGTAAGCYRAYPRCPADRNRLIHYLNNYNGGFFRLFAKTQLGGKSKSPYFRHGFGSSEPWLGYAPAYGFLNEPRILIEHRGPIISDHGSHGRIVSPVVPQSDKRIVFPGNREDQLFRFPKFSVNLEEDSPQYPSFFPEEEEEGAEEGAEGQEFTGHPTGSAPEPNFTFP